MHCGEITLQLDCSLNVNWWVVILGGAGIVDSVVTNHNFCIRKVGLLLASWPCVIKVRSGSSYCSEERLYQWWLRRIFNGITYNNIN